MPGVEALTGGGLTLAGHVGRLDRGNAAGEGRVGVDQEAEDDLVVVHTVLRTEGRLLLLQEVTQPVRTGGGLAHTAAVAVGQRGRPLLSLS